MVTTLLRMILFAVLSSTSYMAIQRLNTIKEDQEDVSLKDYVYIIVAICGIVEVTTYLNYKQSAELFLRAKTSE